MAEKYGKKVRELMVKEMKDTFTGNKGFVFASVENVKADEMDVLRKKMRQSGSKYFVLKNRLAQIALKEAGLDELCDVVKENKTFGVGVITDDPVKIAKITMEFAKKNKGFSVSRGYLEGRVIDSAKVKELAELPGREQLIAMVLQMMNAPISGFVGVLSGVLRSLLYALNSIKEKKEESGK